MLNYLTWSDTAHDTKDCNSDFNVHLTIKFLLGQEGRFEARDFGAFLLYKELDLIFKYFKFSN